MKNFLIKNSKQIFLILFFFVIVLLYFIYVEPFFKSDNFQSLIKRFSTLGVIFVLLGLTASEVFAPLPGSPVYIASASIFGWSLTIIIGYFASIASSVINFYIARKWGRGIVKKMVGQKNMTRVDRFSNLEGQKSLIALRLFGFFMYDFISYAYGLSIFSFKRFLFITVICHAFINLIYLFTINFMKLTDTQTFIFWYFSMFMVVPFLFYFLKKFNAIKAEEIIEDSLG
ncbi:MAG: VTT domain-containing protein [bacterium]